MKADTKETIHISSEAEMLTFGAHLSKVLQGGDLLCLSGDLGAGKTVLARGIIQALMAPETIEVTSPTYSLVHEYSLSKGMKDTNRVLHADLYRLENPNEIMELGLDDALLDGIVIMEWPERLASPIAKNPLLIKIMNDADTSNGRIILLSGLGWEDRIKHLGSTL